ncbi:protein HOMOLOG OF MAMMALIAN LYST-INTERACTING PROTEIN 5-like [Andrographis paniculata]|uniref:protein HOMOLOG OF MAMMALIAN LYST-INTERACTING PROTEIN 5-like n=1 Tax=Andrographis paniculata TaxID=175694 RepID=UPI0021E78A0B|nr:protein HOMOLOG OF MAMMALIAN LYST-INTERACTING PROTEIN 5-like [Andrographis paniculata]
MATEPAKLLLPFLQRADELQKHEPLVAYYCRLYAMERGLKIPQQDRTKTTNSLLVSLMGQLEKDKKSLKLSPDDYLYVEGFASNVFAKADKQDRAGRADLNTAKTYYAASLIFEILNQFGPLQPELEQKQKYAAWKAADIRKALKEGKKPVPGPPGGDDDASITSSGEYDLNPTIEPDSSRANSSPSFPTDSDSNLPSEPFRDHLQRPTFQPPPPNYPYGNPPPVEYHQSPHPDRSYPSESHQPYPSQNMLPHAYPSHTPPAYLYPNFQSYPSFNESSLPSHYPTHYQGSDIPDSVSPQQSSTRHNSAGRNSSVSDPSPVYNGGGDYEPPPEQIGEAQKAARFAVGALAFEDVSVAIEHLKKALELLTKPSSAR